MIRGAGDEFILGRVLQRALPDRLEPLVHLSRDEGRAAEQMTALRDIDRAKLACPLVHVLKDVTMQLAIPVGGQRNRRQALTESLRRRQPLELLEIVEQVAKLFELLPKSSGNI